MERSAKMAILQLLNEYPTCGNPDLTAETWMTTLADLPALSITETVQRFLSGEVEGHNPNFCPRLPIFCAEARKQARHIELRSRPRLPAPAPKPEPVITPEEQARVQFKRSIWALVEFTEKAANFADKQRTLTVLIEMARELGVEVPAEIERQAAEQRRAA